MSIKIRALTDDPERHPCQSRKEGDWFIYSCPQCGYERKVNYKTSKTKIINEGESPLAMHFGTSRATGSVPGTYHSN